MSVFCFIFLICGEFVGIGFELVLKVLVLGVFFVFLGDFWYLFVGIDWVEVLFFDEVLLLGWLVVLCYDFLVLVILG